MSVGAFYSHQRLKICCSGGGDNLGNWCCEVGSRELSAFEYKCVVESHAILAMKGEGLFCFLSVTWHQDQFKAVIDSSSPGCVHGALHIQSYPYLYGVNSHSRWGFSTNNYAWHCTRLVWCSVLESVYVCVQQRAGINSLLGIERSGKWLYPKCLTLPWGSDKPFFFWYRPLGCRLKFKLSQMAVTAQHWFQWLAMWSLAMSWNVLCACEH